MRYLSRIFGRPIEPISVERAVELTRRIFTRQTKPVEVAVGVYECPHCLVFTDSPEKHRHEEIA